MVSNTGFLVAILVHGIGDCAVSPNICAGNIDADGMDWSD